MFRKNLPRRYKVIKNKKQLSFHTPMWIYKNRYDFYDVKNFLEVDYFTLSSVVLYTPYIKSYYTPSDNFDLRINTYRLYN